MQISRRSFLKSSSLVIAISLPSPRKAYGANNNTMPTHYFEITPEGDFFFTSDKAEMGQGVLMGQLTLFGEESDIDPLSFKSRTAPVDPIYATLSGLQITGGSTSTKERWQVLREAGAQVRNLMLQAAQKDLSIPLSDLTTDNGYIIKPDGTKWPYAQFIETAKTLKLPSPVSLKKKKDFKYIGKIAPHRVDAIEKSSGVYGFGIDFYKEGLNIAVVERCPTFGGKVKSYNKDEVLTSIGVKDVFEIHSGVAIVCEKYWQTIKARQILNVEWDLGKNKDLSSEIIIADYKSLVAKQPGKELFSHGDIDNSFSKADEIIDVEYELPYLAHATMEPMNCAAEITPQGCDVWCPTQAPTVVRNQVADFLDLDRDKVRVHSSKYLGGGFGRRSTTDYPLEAVAIAKKLKGPVQVIWSREDDTTQSPMRPINYSRMKASLKEGILTGWQHQLGCESLLQYVIPGWIPTMLPGWVPDGLGRTIGDAARFFMGLTGAAKISIEGAENDYKIPNKSIQHYSLNLDIPIHFWRSVGHSYTGFVVESFIDEIAHKLKKDPYEFRKSLLDQNSRIANVLNKVAAVSSWQAPLPKGVSRGIACHTSFDSFVAQVAEIEVKQNKIQVKKVFCVVDCGIAVNPDVIKQQMESGIIYGLSAALNGEITLKNGAVMQNNFDSYEPLRMNQCPEIEVHIVESNEPPTGVGEPGLPPLAAAVGNAVFNATGKRLRSLPLRLT